MSFTNLVKQCIPPILLKGFKQVIFHQKKFKSFNNALKKSTSSLGYENPYFVEVAIEESKEFKAHLFESQKTYIDESVIRSLIPFAFLNPRQTLNIIDVGGSTGIHYYPLKKILVDKYKFKWHVVETTALANAAKSIENEELKFFNNFKDAANSLEHIDLIIASGSIQYFENPKQALTELINLGPQYILLTRLSLTKSDKEVITLQKSLLSSNLFEKLPKGYSDRFITYPHTSIREVEFENIINKGYRIKLYFDDDSGSHDLGGLNQIGYGVFLEKLK